MKSNVEQLAKTAKSLTQHIARGYGTQGRRSSELIIKYEHFKNIATKEEWAEHCANHGWSTSHTAYDFFA